MRIRICVAMVGGALALAGCQAEPQSLAPSGPIDGRPGHPVDMVPDDPVPAGRGYGQPPASPSPPLPLIPSPPIPVTVEHPRSTLSAVDPDAPDAIIPLAPPDPSALGLVGPIDVQLGWDWDRDRLRFEVSDRTQSIQFSDAPGEPPTPRAARLRNAPRRTLSADGTWQAWWDDALFVADAVTGQVYLQDAAPAVGGSMVGLWPWDDEHMALVTAEGSQWVVWAVQRDRPATRLGPIASAGDQVWPIDGQMLAWNTEGEAAWARRMIPTGEVTQVVLSNVVGTPARWWGDKVLFDRWGPTDSALTIVDFSSGRATDLPVRYGNSFPSARGRYHATWDYETSTIMVVDLSLEQIHTVPPPNSNWTVGSTIVVDERQGRLILHDNRVGVTATVDLRSGAMLGSWYSEPETWMTEVRGDGAWAVLGPPNTEPRGSYTLLDLSTGTRIPLDGQFLRFRGDLAIFEPAPARLAWWVAGVGTPTRSVIESRPAAWTEGPLQDPNLVLLHEPDGTFSMIDPFSGAELWQDRLPNYDFIAETEAGLWFRNPDQSGLTIIDPRTDVSPRREIALSTHGWPRLWRERGSVVIRGDPIVEVMADGHQEALPTDAEYPWVAWATGDDALWLVDGGRLVRFDADRNPSVRMQLDDLSVQRVHVTADRAVVIAGAWETPRVFSVAVSGEIDVVALPEEAAQFWAAGDRHDPLPIDAGGRVLAATDGRVTAFGPDGRGQTLLDLPAGEIEALLVRGERWIALSRDPEGVTAWLGGPEALVALPVPDADGAMWLYPLTDDLAKVSTNGADYLVDITARALHRFPDDISYVTAALDPGRVIAYRQHSRAPVVWDFARGTQTLLLPPQVGRVDVQGVLSPRPR